MATIEQIKALFPLKATITNEIIKTSNISKADNCIGANTLKQALPQSNEIKVLWANWDGGVFINDKAFSVTTEEKLMFMGVREETEITFIIE